jgi:hypothetical protein
MAVTYPVRVEATLDQQLSRWRWLVKWLLAIPHYVVLAFLWIAFVILSVAAFFAILFTGTYPRGIFGFNVGVLRWTWRVHYYAFGALGTDRYPPFTLNEVPEYPAHLEIGYPEHLSRGLVLVKWWLLAIPHYLVIGVFLGGGTWLAWRAGEDSAWAPFGLIGLLVLIAAVILLFTGNYPKQIFDFVLGMNRWVLRVAAYAALMTDRYPPFQLDMGGHDPATTLVIPPPGPPVTLAKPAAAPARPGWATPRIVAIVFGAILSLVTLGLVAGGGVALWFDQHRADGYVSSSSQNWHSEGYAITSENVSFGRWERDVLDTVRIRATNETTSGALFVGIAPTDAVNRYLGGVSRTIQHDLLGDSTTTRTGTATPAAPGTTPIWTTSASGSGQQTIIWKPSSGDWTVVVMNADASSGVRAQTEVGAKLPDLGWLAVGLLSAAATTMAGALLLLIVPIRRASRTEAPSSTEADDGQPCSK